MLEQLKISLLTVRNQLTGGCNAKELCVLSGCCLYHHSDFGLMVRGSLCELHIRQGNTELSAYLAYEVEQR